ncbi:hypothetical protein J3R82DRAFT_2621 [Butyriboletus roseoflavus]|nr:hypothetical protein J3R82DRAFT_2621 [Butyriboletus roseoflavus]
MDNTWEHSPPLPVPLDILLDIVAHLPLQSVLALRRTCKSLYAVTHLRSLWALLFRTHVLDRHIPCPNLGTTPLADLSAHNLESLTHRALTLRRTWTSPSPVPRRTITLNTPTEPSARIIFLQFLPGRSNRWLISVRMTAQPRTYLLQCWDLAREQPRCVAELRHADGPYGGVVLNSDPTSSAVLAMQSAQTEMFSVHFDAEDPECAFETQATIDGIRELHLLSGSTLVTRRIDDGGALCLWDLPDLRQEKLQLLNPSLIQPDDRVQAIHLAHDYAIVVRIQSIEIYTTTPRPSLLSARGAPIAYPLAQFKFQWRTDTVMLCEQHASSSPSPRPIHLFVRFGSIFPWPVNVLHHYLLLPNPIYRTGGRAHGRGGRTPTLASTQRSSPTTPPSTSSHSSSPTFTFTTEHNLPYDPRPHPIHTIGSPLRLFGQSAMTLGRYGTALWLDNHTEDWLGPSEHGQRLAGRMVQLVDEGLAMVGVGAPGGGGSGGVQMATTPATGAEPTVPTNSSGASMVFGMRGDDAWTRIATEEEAGRIALGHTDGAITLLEY